MGNGEREKEAHKLILTRLWSYRSVIEHTLTNSKSLQTLNLQFQANTNIRKDSPNLCYISLISKLLKN